MYTKTTAGNEVPVTPGTQASPSLAKEARYYIATSICRQKNLGLSLSDHSLLQRLGIKPRSPHPPFLLQNFVQLFLRGILHLGGLLLKQVTRADHQGFSPFTFDSAREQPPVLSAQTAQRADTQISMCCPPVSCLHSDPALFPTLRDLSGE